MFGFRSYVAKADAKQACFDGAIGANSRHS